METIKSKMVFKTGMGIQMMEWMYSITTLCLKTKITGMLHRNKQKLLSAVLSHSFLKAKTNHLLHRLESRYMSKLSKAITITKCIRRHHLRKFKTNNNFKMLVLTRKEFWAIKVKEVCIKKHWYWILMKHLFIHLSKSPKRNA